VEELKQARAEVGRMRSALESIAAGNYSFGQCAATTADAIAKQALAGGGGGTTP
jgi:hypothetical protein